MANINWKRPQFQKQGKVLLTTKDDEERREGDAAAQWLKRYEKRGIYDKAKGKKREATGEKKASLSN